MVYWNASGHQSSTKFVHLLQVRGRKLRRMLHTSIRHALAEYWKVRFLMVVSSLRKRKRFPALNFVLSVKCAQSDIDVVRDLWQIRGTNLCGEMRTYSCLLSTQLTRTIKFQSKSLIWESWLEFASEWTFANSLNSNDSFQMPWYFATVAKNLCWQT